MPHKSEKKTGRTETLIDLEKIPSPYLSGAFDLKSVKSLELVMARGCNKRCSYCAINESPLRYFPFERIEKELAYVVKEAPELREIVVAVADMFDNAPLAGRVLPILKAAAEKHHIRVFFYVNVGSLHKHHLAALSDCEYFDIEIGIQSLETQVLSLCHRISDPQRIRESISTFKTLSPASHKVLGLISCLPKDSLQSYCKSLDWSISTGLDIAVNHLRIIPGTELYKLCMGLGYEVSADYPYFVTRTDKLTPGQIAELRETTQKVFFALKVIRSAPELRADFLAAGARLPLEQPYLFLSRTITDWLGKAPRTAKILRQYLKNLKRSGTLDINLETGHFNAADLEALKSEYHRLQSALNTLAPSGQKHAQPSPSRRA